MIKKLLHQLSRLGTLEFLLIAFFTWRLLITVFGLLGILFLPVGSPFLGGSEGANEENYLYLRLPLFWGWANFDGVHYWQIAKTGYSQFQQAFFPFFPLLVRVSANFLGGLLFSGLIITHLCFFISLYLFYHLARLDFKKPVVKLALILLLFFPTSFYFGSFYTESLFLSLSLASFYAARKKSWLWAGVLGGFASATRLAGIFLLPALVVEAVEQARLKKGQVKIKDLLPLLLIPFGLSIYMFYLWRSVGDPFYFFHVQPLFGAHRSGSNLVLLYQVFWRYLKIFLTVPLGHPYFIAVLELASFILFFALLIIGWVSKRIRLSYLVFGFGLLLLPTLTGTLSSIPRYVLPIFPGFLILAYYLERIKFLKWLFILAGLILGLVCTMLFIRGYWIS